MMRKFLLAASLLTAPFVGMSVAHAGVFAQVDIGDGNGFQAASIVPTPFAPAGNYTYGYSAGDYSVNGSVTTLPALTSPDTDTTAVNVANNGIAGTVTVEISVTGLTSPLGVWNALSGFDTNSFTGNIVSVDEATYIGISGNAFDTATQLASAHFTTANTSTSEVQPTPDLKGTYSETVEYIITFGASNTQNSANDSIDITNVPEPASLALLGAGLAGLGMIRRRKKNNAAAA